MCCFGPRWSWWNSASIFHLCLYLSSFLFLNCWRKNYETKMIWFYIGLKDNVLTDIIGSQWWMSRDRYVNPLLRLVLKRLQSCSMQSVETNETSQRFYFKNECSQNSKMLINKRIPCVVIVIDKVSSLTLFIGTHYTGSLHLLIISY